MRTITTTLALMMMAVCVTAAQAGEHGTNSWKLRSSTAETAGAGRGVRVSRTPLRQPHPLRQPQPHAPAAPAASAAPDAPPSISARRNAVMVFAGPALDDRLGKIASLDFQPDFIAAGIVGGAASHEIARLGPLSIEAEIGAGGQLSTEMRSAGSQFWLGAFLRYDAFPWNHIVRTSVAASTGINFASRPAYGEINGKEDRTSRLLHYLAPEITFAAPSRPQRELVVRLHHRSGAYGLFGCTTCATNFLTTGLRHRF